MCGTNMPFQKIAEDGTRTGAYAATHRGIVAYLEAAAVWADEQASRGRLDNDHAPKIRLRFERGGQVVYREYNPLRSVWRKLQADTARKNRDVLPDVAALAWSYYSEAIAAGTDKTGRYRTPFGYRQRFGQKRTAMRCGRCQARGIHTVVTEFDRSCPAQHGRHRCGHTSTAWQDLRQDEDGVPHLCCNRCGKVVSDTDSTCTHCDNHSDDWKQEYTTVSGQEPAAVESLQELLLRCLKYACQHVLRENRGSVDVNSVAEGSYSSVDVPEFLDSVQHVLSQTTPREQTLLRLRRSGLNFRTIANTLNISTKTVQASLSRVRSLTLAAAR